MSFAPAKMDEKNLQLIFHIFNICPICVLSSSHIAIDVTVLYDLSLTSSLKSDVIIEDMNEAIMD